MNKNGLCLLMVMTLGIGVIPLSIYLLNNKEIGTKSNDTLATGGTPNIITIDYSTGSYGKYADTFEVGGGSIEMKAYDKDHPPIPNTTKGYMRYPSLNMHGGLAGQTFTTSGLYITKFTLTAHNTFNYKVNAIIDSVNSISGSWDNQEKMVFDSIAHTTFSFYNSETGNRELRLDMIEIEYANSVDYDSVKTFVNIYMHMTDYDPTLSGEGENLCLGENGYYMQAKGQVVNFSESELNIFMTNSHFAKYHERYIAWASANKDNNPYSL